MQPATEFRRCLIELDVTGIRRLWQQISPHLPQPQTDAETLAALHSARVQMKSIPEMARAYSQQWLIDRGHSRIVEAVGIAVKSKYPEVKRAVTAAMSEVVLEAYADRKTDPEFVRKRMQEARERELKGLGLCR